MRSSIVPNCCAALKIIGAGCALAILSPAHAATPTAGFVNGSFSGPASNGSVPTGWTTLVASPDTVDINNNAGSPFYAFPVTPSASPDGGTWVGMATDNFNNFSERFGQTVSGFTVGVSYTVSWYASNFGFGGAAPFGYTAPGRVEVLVDGISIGVGNLLPLQPGWVAESLAFTASATTLQISFNTALGPRAYLGIEGVGLLPTATVPEPAGSALLALGMLSLLIRDRTLRRREGPPPLQEAL